MPSAKLAVPRCGRSTCSHWASKLATTDQVQNDSPLHPSTSVLWPVAVGCGASCSTTGPPPVARVRLAACPGVAKEMIRSPIRSDPLPAPRSWSSEIVGLLLVVVDELTVMVERYLRPSSRVFVQDGLVDYGMEKKDTSTINTIGLGRAAANGHVPAAVWACGAKIPTGVEPSAAPRRLQPSMWPGRVGAPM